MCIPDEIDTHFEMELDRTEDVTVAATIAKDGKLIDVSVIEHKEPWITNLEPFGDH